MKIFLYSIICITSILGILHIFTLLWAWINKPKEKVYGITVIPIGENILNIEQIIRHKMSTMFVNNKELSQEIVIIDKGMTESNKKICKILSDEYDAITILTPKQFLNYINEID